MSYLPFAGAAGLIRHMLTVNPARRATVKEILEHWWVNLGFELTPDGRNYEPAPLLPATSSRTRSSLRQRKNSQELKSLDSKELGENVHPQTDHYPEESKLLSNEQESLLETESEHCDLQQAFSDDQTQTCHSECSENQNQQYYNLAEFENQTSESSVHHQLFSHDESIFLQDKECPLSDSFLSTQNVDSDDVLKNSSLNPTDSIDTLEDGPKASLSELVTSKNSELHSHSRTLLSVEAEKVSQNFVHSGSSQGIKLGSDHKLPRTFDKDFPLKHPAIPPPQDSIDLDDDKVEDNKNQNCNVVSSQSERDNRRYEAVIASLDDYRNVSLAHSQSDRVREKARENVGNSSTKDRDHLLTTIVPVKLNRVPGARRERRKILEQSTEKSKHFQTNTQKKPHTKPEIEGRK